MLKFTPTPKLWMSQGGNFETLNENFHFLLQIQILREKYVTFVFVYFFGGGGGHRKLPCNQEKCDQTRLLSKKSYFFIEVLTFKFGKIDAKQKNAYSRPNFWVRRRVILMNSKCSTALGVT